MLGLPIGFAGVLLVWGAITGSRAGAFGAAIVLALGTAIVYLLPGARRVMPATAFRLVGAAMIAAGLILGFVAVDADPLWSFVGIALVLYGTLVFERPSKKVA